MKNLSFPTTLILCVSVLGVAACAAQPGGEGRSGAGAPASDEAGAAPAGDSGEVPEELVAEIVDDLVTRTGAERAAVEVRRAEAVTWRDGSLGCREPGMMSIQVLTEGYWVILRVSGEEYDFRARRGGDFLLCEQEDRVGPAGG